MTRQLRPWLFYLSLAAFFLGIALQEIMLALLVLFQTGSALFSGRGPASVFTRPRLPALFFALVLLMTAAMAQFFNPDLGTARIHWALVAFWALSPTLYPHLRLGTLHRVLLLVSLPGLLWTGIGLLLHPDQTPPSGLVSGWATYSEGLVVLACWSFFRDRTQMPAYERRLIDVHLLIVTLMITLWGSDAGRMMCLVLVVLGSASAGSRTLPLPLVRMLMGLLLVIGLAVRPPAAPQFIETWQRTTADIAAHPWWGVGPNRLSSQDPELPLDPRHTLLGLTLESGFLGLLAYLIFMIGLAIQLWRAPTEQQGVPSLRMIFLCWWVLGFFHYNLGDTELLILHAYHWAAITCLSGPRD